MLNCGRKTGFIFLTGWEISEQEEENFEFWMKEKMDSRFRGNDRYTSQ
jgi:hypothetical protein